MMQTGGHDSYNAPSSCQNLVNALPTSTLKSMLTVNVYPDAYHGWDRLQPPFTYADPLANYGQGDNVQVIPNIPDAVVSRTRVVQFFSKIFGISHP